MIDMLKEIILDFQEIDLPTGVPRRIMVAAWRFVGSQGQAARLPVDPGQVTCLKLSKVIAKESRA
jgi:hypothetical protein